MPEPGTRFSAGTKLRCPFDGYVWLTRADDPAMCPQCHNRFDYTRPERRPSSA
jgi:hypothetical protein